MKICDLCCGSKMFYFNKENPLVTFMDIREENTRLSGDQRKFVVSPDVVGDFRNAPFSDETFDMVVFDPPHLIHCGDNSLLAIKYGKLNASNWKEDLKKGFSEAFRILKKDGTLIFKWSEKDIKLKDVLALSPYEPLLGFRRENPIFLVFVKTEESKKKAF